MKPVIFPPVTNNQHLAELQEYFGPLFRDPAALPDLSFIFICYTNRSGSNFLAELLASSGQYNRAGEVLNWPGIKSIAERRRLISFQETFALLANKFQQSGTFIVKAAPAHIEVMVKSWLLDRIIDRSQFIYLERGDRLAQAISHALAFSTRSFSSKMAPAVDPQSVEFSRRAIDQFLAMLGSSARDHTAFFGTNGIVPVHVLYERLVDDPERETMRIASELRLPDFSVDMSKVQLTKQGGEINTLWRRLYLAGED